MPDPIEFVVIPFALAAGVSLAVLLAGWWLDRSAFRGRWVSPLALMIGMLVPYWWITESIPSFPPRDARERWLYLLVVAGLTGVILALVRLRTWMQVVIIEVVILSGFVLMLWNPLHNPEESATVVTLLGLAGLVGLVWWWAMDPALSDLEPVTSPLAMFVLAFGGAALLMMSASAMYGRLAFAFSGAATALVAVSIFRREFLARGCGIVLVAGLGGILLAGNYYAIADERWMNLVLLASAPALMCLRPSLPAVRERSVKGAIASVALIIMPVIVALSIAVPRFFKNMQDDVGDLGY